MSVTPGEPHPIELASRVDLVFELAAGCWVEGPGQPEGGGCVSP